MQLPTQLRLNSSGHTPVNPLGKTKVEFIDSEYTFFSEDVLFKQGCRTGLTVGRYHGINPTVVVGRADRTTRQTHEHVIVSPASSPLSFSMDGDAGSWILSKFGDLVGLLWGGTKDQAFFTPIGMVVDDIEARTGCKVELP